MEPLWAAAILSVFVGVVYVEFMAMEWWDSPARRMLQARIVGRFMRRRRDSKNQQP